MMDDVQYLDDAAVLLLNLMKKTFGDRFNSYYEGDPIDIPKDSLPALIVENVTTQVRTGQATGTDDMAEQLSIKVVYDKAADFGASDDFDTTERKLRRIVQGRSRATGQYHPDSLLFALRQNITLNGYEIDQTVDIEYDLQPRPGGLVTSEAAIAIVTRERIPVAQRF